MADSGELDPGEQVEEETRATYYLSRMLAQSGFLQLTRSRMIFRPTGTLDRALGAERLVIPLHTIRAVNREGDHPLRMSIETGVRTHLFVGRVLAALSDRLEALLREAGGGQAGEEPSLASEKTNYLPSRMRAVGGTLLLTPTRLVFAPGGALDRLTGAKDVALPLDEIVEVRSGGTLDRRTTILTRMASYEFQGHLSGDFLARLQGARAASGGTGTPRPRPDDDPLSDGRARHGRMDAHAGSEGPRSLCRPCGGRTFPSPYRFCPFCGGALVQDPEKVVAFRPKT